MCCVYIYLLLEDIWTVAISFECLGFCETLEDIQMILQLSECLSATNICEQNMLPCAILCLCNTIVIQTRLVLNFKDS